MKLSEIKNIKDSDQIRNKILAQVYTQLKNKTWSDFRRQLTYQVLKQAGLQSWYQVWNHQLWYQLSEQVGSKIWSQVNDQINDQKGEG